MVSVTTRAVASGSHRNEAVNEKRIVDNSERPARPEPDEDPATRIPPVREGQKRPDGTVERTDDIARDEGSGSS